MSSGLRSIVREFRFQHELERLEADVQRADEFTEAAEFVLARDPHEGQPVEPGGLVWAIPVNSVANMPAMVLYYTFNDQYVILLSIQLAMMSEDDLTDCAFLD